MFDSLKIAFATYSRIPTPPADWNEHSMKYAMCFFPLGGVVLALLCALAWLVLTRLGLHAFFPVGEEEGRAGTIHKGETAVDAAGTIHSDLAKGFIRAEVVAWNEILEAGTYQGAKKANKVRLEGKEYVVKDGDVLLIRFNV